MSEVILEQPVVFARNGDVYTTSMALAGFFGKEHRNVLRAIDDLLNSEQIIPAAYLIESSYNDHGRSYRSFDLNKSGFALLAMGFTGEKALQFKLAYIDAFNAMEAELLTPKRQTRAKPVNTEPKPTRITGALANALEAALKHKLGLLPNLSQPSKQLLCREYAAQYGVDIPVPVLESKMYTGGVVAKMLGRDIASLKQDTRYKALRQNPALGEYRLAKVNDGRKETEHWYWNEAGKDSVLATFRPAGSVVPFRPGEDDEVA